MARRQPAWFTMLLIALHDDPKSANAETIRSHLDKYKMTVDEKLRESLKNIVTNHIMNDLQAKIPDSVLWSLADVKWNPSPVLQAFNTFCVKKQWQPIWHSDAHQVIVDDRTYRLSPDAIETVMKKKQKKARLAAMVLIDHNDLLLDPAWAAHN